MDNLNSEIVLAFPTLVPPHDEQRGIIAATSEMVTKLNVLRAKREMQLERLVEHRQALITAAVTGELDIPRVAA